MNQKFLEEMLTTCSVSGHEEVLQEKIISYMKESCDELVTDAAANVISVLNPEADTRILLCSHVDEIGFIITNILSDGSLKVVNTGGIHAVLYLGTHVQITTKRGIVYGVVITNSSLVKKSEISVSDLTIDIGASSKEEAQRYVSVGDPVCAATSFQYLINNRMCARAMDDRIGAFIILEAFRKAKENGCKNGIYSVTSVGEETSSHGAYWASQRIKPTCAIAVDVTYTSDYEGVDGNATGEVELGKGAVLCHNSLVSKKLNQMLTDCAERLNVKVQWEIAGGMTYTDGDKIHFTNDGVPMALVSIPLRYMHSSVEELSLNDVRACIDLLCEFICSFDGSADLNPLSVK